MMRLFHLLAAMLAAMPVPALGQASERGGGLGLPRPDRPVARIVSPSWDTEANRDRAREAAMVMRLMNIRPGETVADIGAGSGYYTLRLSPAVGPAGKVFAQDVTPAYLEQLRARVRRAGLTNVTFVRGTGSDPRLPAASIDAALLAHMYHEISEPYALLYRLRLATRPEGRIGIVDLDRTPENHGMPRSLLICEVQAVGWQHVATHDLAVGYLAIFRPGPPKEPRSVTACRRGGGSSNQR
jgi:SAM-dependent methyltransferase